MKAFIASLTSALAGFAFSMSAWSSSLVMAPYAESYVGPKTLTVQLATTARGDRALIKVMGINHPWDNKVVMTELRKDANGRTDYVARVQNKDYVVLYSSPDRGTRLSLPGEVEQSLSFDRAAALEVVPQHLLADYERPDGAAK